MFRVKLLEYMQLELDSKPVDAIAGIRAQAILALLLMSPNKPVYRTELAGRLWPDSSENQARTNLRREIHGLKSHHSLIASCLNTQRHTIQWCIKQDWTLDVFEFESAVSEFHQQSDVQSKIRVGYIAVEVYRGELLPHISVSSLSEKREKLACEWHRLVDELIPLLMSIGDYDRAASLAKSALSKEPLKESLYLQLMQIYVASQNNALAIHTFHTCASRLSTDLGVEPNSALVSLHRKISRIHLDTVGDASDGYYEKICERTLFVGRCDAIGQLREAIFSRLDPLLFIIVSGDAGIGKTRLVEEVIRAETLTGIVARANCYSSAGNLAYSPFLQWMQTPQFSKLFEAIDPFWQRELILHFPEVQTFLEFDYATTPIRSTESTRYRLFEAILKLVTAEGVEKDDLSVRPRVLVIDDVQWCDKDFMDFLEYLSQQCQAISQPIRIVATQRIESVTQEHQLSIFKRQLVMLNQLVEVPLDAINVDDSLALAESMINTMGLVKQDSDRLLKIIKWAGGNPFYLSEAMTYWCTLSSPGIFDADYDEKQAPPRIHALIQERVYGLDELSQSVLHGAAVYGRKVSFTLLGTIVDLPVESLAKIVDLLWQKRLFKVMEDGEFEFYHDCIREAIYAALLPAQRQLLHGVVAQALERFNGESLDSVCGQIASHWDHANRYDTALHWYRRAIRFAKRQLAGRDVMIYADACLRLVENTGEGDRNYELEIELLESKSFAIFITEGFGSDSEIPYLQRLELLMLHTQDARLKFMVLGRLRLHASFSSQIDRALRLVQDQRIIAKSIDDPMLLVEVHRALAFVYYQQGCFVEMLAAATQGIDYIESAIENSEEETGGPLWSVSMLRALYAYGLCTTGNTDAARAAFLKCNDYDLSVGDDHSRGLVFLWIGYIHLMLGDYGLADEVGQKLIVIGETCGLLKIKCMGQYICGSADLQLGKNSRALQKLENAVCHIESIEDYMPVITWYPDLAEAYRRDGRFQDALQVLDKAKKASRISGVRKTEAKRHVVLAQLLADMDADSEDVLEEYECAVSIACQTGAAVYHLQALVAWYLFCASRQLPVNKVACDLENLISEFTCHGDSIDLQRAVSALAVGSMTVM